MDRSADNIHDGVISSELAFKAYDGVGIKGDALDNCLSAYGVQLDKEAFAKRLEEAKKMSKQSSLISNLLDDVKVGKTDDSYKHQYHKLFAETPPLVSKRMLMIKSMTKRRDGRR